MRTSGENQAQLVKMLDVLDSGSHHQQVFLAAEGVMALEEPVLADLLRLANNRGTQFGKGCENEWRDHFFSFLVVQLARLEDPTPVFRHWRAGLTPLLDPRILATIGPAIIPTAVELLEVEILDVHHEDMLIGALTVLTEIGPAAASAVPAIMRSMWTHEELDDHYHEWTLRSIGVEHSLALLSKAGGS